MLFPFDFGDESPNPANAHVEKGTFAFDHTRAGGARPYVWANIICGITCLKGMMSAPSVTGCESTQFHKWPEVAAQQRSHIRFKEVVSTIRARLLALTVLRRQLDQLLVKQMPVMATDLGFPKEPESRLDEFKPAASHTSQERARLGRCGTDGKYTEIWSMSVSRAGVKIKCLIGIEPDYPIGTPVFHVMCESKKFGISERDFLDLENRVNSFSIREEHKIHQDLLLGSQIMAMLTYVDQLVDSSTANAAVGSNAASIPQATGTTNPKDAMEIERP